DHAESRRWLGFFSRKAVLARANRLCAYGALPRRLRISKFRARLEAYALLATAGRELSALRRRSRAALDHRACGHLALPARRTRRRIPPRCQLAARNLGQRE